MSRNSKGRAWRRVAVSISLFTLLFSSLGGAAGAAPPPVANVVITAVADEGTGVPVPIVNEPFSVAVSLVDSAGNPYLVNQQTTISLSVSGGTASLGGNTTGTILRNESSTTISGVTYPNVENVTLHASGSRLTTGSWFLAVQKTAVGIMPSPQAFIVSTCGPGDPSAANPMCSEVTFHNGVGSTGWFGVGACVGFQEGAPECPQVEASLFSLIASLEGFYSKTDPLAVFWKCHKSVCETGTAGPSSGVPFAGLYVQPDDGSGFVESPPCPSKGTIGPDQKFCTDYVQSGRSAGNLILVLLFEGDPQYRR